MMKKLLGRMVLVGVALCIGAGVVRADGTISGVVIDGLTGQPVRGAELQIADADVEVSSDVGGSFQMALPAGTYTVLVTREGFESQEITAVVVVDEEVADFAVVLLPATDVSVSAGLVDEGGEVSSDAAFAGEITVVAEVEKSTEAALLAERRASSDIADFIGSQEISKNTGSDAASVLKSVTGVSLQQDKYVFVRGLGERYSNTTLNGSRLPTTEFDKKVVPLDLFPAKLLDKVRVSKSYSVDMPGDFAAGSVELNTLDFPAQSTFSLSLGASSRSDTTGEPFGRYVGGLSFTGGGGQAMPGDIPDDQLVRYNPFLGGNGYTPDELASFGQSFIGAWTADGTEAGYLGSDYSNASWTPNFSLNYGDTFGNLGVVISGTQSRGFDHTLSNQKYYTLGVGDELRLQNDYDFATDAETVRSGLVGNLAYRLGSNHKVELRTVTTRDSKSESRYFEGYNDDQSTDVRDYRVRYQREEIASYQLSGEHFLEGWGDGDLLEWRGAFGTATNKEDLRESLYKYENSQFILTDESQSAFLLFNDLADDNSEAAMDWTHFFSSDAVYGSLQFGGAFNSRDREFSSRRFRYTFRDIGGLDMSLLPEELLIEENINPDGFEIKEETRPTDTYQANQDVAAVYAMTDVTFGRWRFVGGLRYEDSSIEVVTYDPFDLTADPIISTVEDGDFMPSLSAVYKLGDRSNLRGALSQTVNRPEFRELAPFEFTDVVGGRSARGNPYLVSANITNYDLRWEWYPDSFGVVAASVFHKDFSDPIERTLISSVELVSTWRNVEQAENTGFELEFRRDLAFISQSLAPLAVQLNYTWVDSTINVGDDDPVPTNTERPLVGQPDQVYNVVLEWQPSGWGTTTRLLYTHTGEKIFEAGGFGIPDVYDQPFSTLDFVWLQQLDFLASGLGMKLSLTNILDEEFRRTGGFDETYKPGRGVGLSLSYTPF